MVNDGADATPQFSVIIAVYNDWAPLDQCLRSLAQQAKAPAFEVIVVDDGSDQPAPEFIQNWNRNLVLAVERQAHAGVSTARNRGVQISKGTVLVFVDADCKLQVDCLSVLASAISESPRFKSFQLRLAGDCSGLVGRAEELRLQTIQKHKLLSDGRIHYLNTAGFAIRRTSVDLEAGLFNPAARRGEDTLLLVNLMESGETPMFVPQAVVQHAVPLSVMQYLRKAIRSAYIEGPTYGMIASKGVRIRVTQRERWNMLGSMWKDSKEETIGRTAFFLLTAKQSLQRAVSLYYRRFGAKVASQAPAKPS
jgi:glycosyltransferase involved in cell wall biosynthesis